MDAIKLLGSLMGNNATGGNVLGSLLGGGGGGGGGGLGALAGMLGGGGSSGGGAGGLGALASMLGGGGGGASGASAGGGLGALLGGLAGGGAPARRPEPKEENDAVLLIKAMCNAAKADGKIDQAEVKNIVGRSARSTRPKRSSWSKSSKHPLISAGSSRRFPTTWRSRSMRSRSWA